MSKKRRLNLRLDEDERALVGSTERFEHLVITFERLAGWYPDHADEWLESAAWVREWMQRSKPSLNSYDD